MAELTRYETYKPSGIDWIGEVPIDWKMLRIKNVASIVNGSTPSSSVEEYWDGDIIWATPGDFNKFDKIIDDSESKITEAGYKSCGTSMVPVGSVVITTRAPIGNVLIAGKELCTNQGCKSLVPNRIESRFLYYIISISSIELNILGQGTTFLELSKESLGTFKLPLPKYDEQLAIANYLDDQTQKIDQLIANKKAQVEKLKELRQIEINNAVTKGLNPNTEMKDSGIEWLGKIPKHWEVKRLKNILLNINSGDGISNDELVEDGEIEVYGGNGVMGYTDKFNSDGKVIIIGRVGAKCGVTYLVDKKIWISDNALQSRTYQNYEFVYYLIDAMNLNNYANQNAQPLITGGILKGLYAALPPKNEQVEIADFLQQRTTAIDQLIKNIEAQIEKLQELRKIRIYEAVTGKIKVNAYAEKTA
jgi:type I restriction enzyme S subunit